MNAAQAKTPHRKPSRSNAAFTIANQDADKAGAFCIRCHVPAAHYGGQGDSAEIPDFDVELMDGINCHFCHRVVSPAGGAIEYAGDVANPDAPILKELAAAGHFPVSVGNAQHIVDPADVRRGPYDDVPANYHGYDEAGEFLADLLATGTVSLVADSGDDTDRYGRLLRHVLVDGKPVGLSMIEAGKANARYDALDGYARHRYQDRYRDADSANAFSCAVVSLPQTSSSAEPWNQSGPDLDCSDIGRKVRIAGIDYHRLDSDGDCWARDSGEFAKVREATAKQIHSGSELQEETEELSAGRLGHIR